MRSIAKLYNWIFSRDRKRVRKLKKLLGFTPCNMAIFNLAFKHSSTSKDVRSNNERLEYLGDAVLDTVISEYLFKKYPLKEEGFLTEMRSKIVNRKRLGMIAENLKLRQFMFYRKNIPINNTSILGNALEALIGAIYLDAGYDAVNKFVLYRIIKPFINLEELIVADINYKSRLLEWTQKFGKALIFETMEEKMVNNSKVFVAGVLIDNQRWGVGSGRSKKLAEKEAAKEAYDRLRIGEEA